jgi:hypothetical protein
MNHKLSMTCCVLVLLCASACSKRLAPRIGLVGEYLFKGNSRDKSSYHNHGQVQRAVLIKGHQGKSASAYEFNGVDQFITIPSSLQNNFKYGQDFSISLWVAIDQNQKDQGSTLNDILRKWRGDTQGYPFAIVYYNHTALDSLQNRFSFVRYDGSICRNSPQLFSAPAKGGKDFTHLVFVKEGDWLGMYQDKKLVAQTKDTTRPEADCGSHNNSEITIGTRNNKVRFFTGAVDDLRIYNRALTKEEIALLFRL